MIEEHTSRRRVLATAGRRTVALTVACIAVGFLGGTVPISGETDAKGERIEIAIRCDDIGMSHSVNMAARELIAAGVPFSASVMFACPWYLEAVEILRANSQIGVGVHLTLNSEWEYYKWGPVAGALAVPSLVDTNGHFHASETEFAAANVNIDEVRVELRAQVERAMATGLRVDYLDYHMLTAVSTPELRAIVEELAAEYGLGLSRYFGESSVSIWDAKPEAKLTSLLTHVRSAHPGLNLLVIHLGMETPEMQALVDLNNEADPYRVGIHRQAELDAVTSAAFRRAIDDAGINFVTYRELIEERGLDSMAPPPNLTSYSSRLGESN
ncbi:MAG: ChbG/HpnK family deacetylase [bacterium]|nr:ChbG/HpnK family deacetylase [bacterium]